MVAWVALVTRVARVARVARAANKAAPPKYRECGSARREMESCVLVRRRVCHSR